MNKQNSETEPTKPMMVRGERYLEFCEQIVVVLFCKRGDDENQEEKTSDHSCPPHKPMPRSS